LFAAVQPVRQVLLRLAFLLLRAERAPDRQALAPLEVLAQA